MNHLTVGVAGHIDHGKTALVRALTGTETDRLKEEQERGMTIVLGFAHLTLAGGEIDFIDVPGHEKFVKTMIAGAAGIHTWHCLVIAANERVKPQTVEHIALMGLLGVKSGIVAVTKSDLVTGAEERERVLDDLRGFLARHVSAGRATAAGFGADRRRAGGAAGRASGRAGTGRSARRRAQASLCR